MRGFQPPALRPSEDSLQWKRKIQLKNKAFYLSVFTIYIGVCVLNFAFADEIHKHDGSLLKGKIIEVIPSASYKIQLAEGSIFVVKFDEIEKVIFSQQSDVPTLKTKPQSTKSERFKRHHITIQGGYFKAISDDLKIYGLDVTNAGLGIVEYRYSFTPSIDGVISGRGWVASDNRLVVELGLSVSTSVTSRFFGVGIRANGKGEEIRPYFQTSVYVVSEDYAASGDLFFTDPVVKLGGTGTETGVGIGFSGGIDIKASEEISIPIEVTYIAANADEDLSGFGISAGINFNF
jgi:hypothetical protein